MKEPIERRSKAIRLFSIRCVRFGFCVVERCRGRDKMGDRGFLCQIVAGNAAHRGHTFEK
jgi:hypothetical protein